MIISLRVALDSSSNPAAWSGSRTCINMGKLYAKSHAVFVRREEPVGDVFVALSQGAGKHRVANCELELRQALGCGRIVGLRGEVALVRENAGAVAARIRKANDASFVQPLGYFEQLRLRWRPTQRSLFSS